MKQKLSQKVTWKKPLVRKLSFKETLNGLNSDTFEGAYTFIPS